MSFNRKIFSERVRNRWSKAQTARLLGISQRTYSAYEDDAPIPFDVLIKMSRLFSQPIDYLLGCKK